MTAKKLVFPDFVPAHVRRQTTLLRNGTGAGSGDEGWIGVLARLQDKLSQVKKILQGGKWLSEATQSALHREKRDLSARIEHAKGDLDCLERLTTRSDPDLEGVYALLAKHISDDKQAWLFIYAAISANIDFARHRDALRSARECKQEIAVAAQTLAERLDSFHRSGIPGPDAFWSIRSLLEIADAREANHIVWRQVRRHVLGEQTLPVEEVIPSAVANDVPALEDDDFPDDDVVVKELEAGEPAATTPEQDRRYAWQVAPSPSDLLKTLSDVANAFEPREHDLIGAALNTRQGSVKTAYVRAFAHLLNENGIALSPPIMRAMAMTATLVLDHKDLVVNYDDVRKARLPASA